MKELKNLFTKLPINYKFTLIILSIMTIISSVFETVTIFLMIPFIKYYFLNQNIQLGSYLKLKQKYIDFINLNFIYLFISFIIVSFIFRILTLRLSNKHVYKIASYFSSLAFSNILDKSYIEIKTFNRTEILALFTSKLNSVISFVFVPFLNIVSSFFLTTLFLTSLFLIDYRVALVTVFLIGGVYIFLVLLFKRIIYNNGKEINSLYEPINQIIIESLNSIRDLILYDAKKTAKKSYSQLNSKLLNIQGESQFYHTVPRYFVEFFSLILIIILALILKNGSNPEIFLPLMGAIAINIQKLVPSAQLLYQSWSSLNGTLMSLSEFNNYLDVPQNENDKNETLYEIDNFKFVDIIDLSFSYKNDNNNVFKNLNFKINSGDIIGIKGTSGSGKSTLIDIIMGFIKPTDGKIIVNNFELNDNNLKNWQSKISFVPQNIFLLNSSILDNILFGTLLESANNKLDNVLEYSQVNQFLNKLPNGINFIIGENGNLLSGGQKQRIAIARALYKSCDIIIFDEPTSSLDNKTTNEFINALNLIPSDKTIIIVSHDDNLLKICHKIIDLT